MSQVLLQPDIVSDRNVLTEVSQVKFEDKATTKRRSPSSKHVTIIEDNKHSQTDLEQSLMNQEMPEFKVM